MVQVTAPAYTRAQGNLINHVHGLSTGINASIPVGPNERGLLGLQLDFGAEKFTRLFDSKGDVSQEVLAFQNRLQTDEKFRLQIQAGIPGYDIRIQDVEEAFWVLVGRAFAKSVVDDTESRDGHIFHLGHDAFHVRHNRVISIIAKTLINSGVCDNGGGIIYYGIQSGGTLKHLPMLHTAQTNTDRIHWGNSTVSHKTRKGLAGLKAGKSGKVLSGDDLMAAIFDVMVKGEYLPLKKVDNPENMVVNVGDLNPLFIATARRSIEARTTMPKDTPLDETLAGRELRMSLDSNPLIARTADIAESLGAKVTLINTRGMYRGAVEPTRVCDPNEKDQSVLDDKLDAVPDPDDDRYGSVSDGRMIKGTDLLTLFAHNLAVHNPLGLQMGAVSDMRASVAATILGKNLTAAGHPIDVIPAAPGYNEFHYATEKALRDGINVAIEVEETSHTMWRPFTSRAFGAVRDVIDQGGDHASLFGIVLEGIRKWEWEGRNHSQQLDHILNTFKVPPTVKTELKPMVKRSHGMAKVNVATEIKLIADQYFGNLPGAVVEEFDTGALISFPGMKAAVLIRHSKSGSGFTISREAVAGDDKAETLTRNLGVAIMEEAVRRARIKMKAEQHPLADFVFMQKDTAEIAAQLANPVQVIEHAVSSVA